jgi:CrcB protein
MTGAMPFLAVGFGAAIGAWMRWGLGGLLNPLFPTLPLGTLASNLVGGFLMGVCMSLLTHFEAISPEVRLLLTTGFLGGLTTFSTFSAETTTLLTRGQYGWMAVILLAHVAGSVALTVLGIVLTDLILESHP